MIKIGTVGQIVIVGLDLPFFKVLDDSESTGGFIILRANNKHLYGAFDDWAEDEGALDRYFEDYLGHIIWLEEL